MIKKIFELERETKGAIRYQELDDAGAPVKIGEGAALGTLYIRKSALVAPWPKSITVIIGTADNILLEAK